MSNLSNVVVIMARCTRNENGFGIRCEEMEKGIWVADWAFPVKEEFAKKEGYDRGEISGSFSINDTYPGCPHCSAGVFFKCGCGKVGCWDTESRSVTCPWCHSKIEIKGEIKSLSAGQDR